MQDILDAALGPGNTTVICPITDHFIAHHGALGGFVRVYCRGGRASPQAVMRALHGVPGIQAVYDRETACRTFDLPPDREADVAVDAERDACLGGAERAHDLSGLQGHRLRTHGGVSESRVPFIFSEPLNERYGLEAGASTLKSYRIFDFALNGTGES